MPLLPTPLGNGLSSLEPTEDVNAAIDIIASAFTDYFAGASVLGVPAEASILGGAPKSAMIGAMSGLNSQNGAANAISSGISAFWNALLGIEVTIWIMTPPTVIIPSTIVIPPGMGGLTSAIQGAFDGNTAGELDLNAAANNLATAIHSTQSGGMVETQIPPASPISSPIL